MDIKNLTDGIEYEWLTDCRVTEVRGITHKPEQVEKGYGFVCLCADERGLDNIEIAVSNGANLIVTDKYIKVPEGISIIKLNSIREGYALLAKNYYHKSCDRLKMMAVVGTNGKSTTAYLIWKLLTKNNVMCGLIGTGFYCIGKQKFKQQMTTPDPMELHNILYLMESAGVSVVVMEVSSHAIYFKKVCGIKFNVGIFTNISQDHLDFFGDMQNIENVKHSFFLDGFSQISIINIDDNSGERLAKKLALPNITYAVDKKADVSVNSYELSCEGCRFNVNLFRETTIFESMLVGKYNIYNVLSAILACKLVGVRIKYLISTLKEIEPLEGRANIYRYNNVNYVIDYAHSPDSLQNILIEFKKLTYGKLIVVFGAGGERDKDKRHKMGEVAEKFSDIVIVTSDNPRRENPLSIMNDIALGIIDKDSLFMIEDRREAIKKAIEIAKRDDTIILAGKGCEEYFEKNGKKYPYNDKNTLEELLDTKWK